MSNNKGSITILALLVLGIFFMSATFLIYSTKSQSLITVNSVNKIQSYYLAESKIKKAFYEDKYYINYIYPYIKERLSIAEIITKEFTMDKEDLDENDICDKVTYKLVNNSNRKEIEIKVDSIYKGIQTSMKAYGPVVNELFDLEKCILPYDLDSMDYLHFYETIEEIKNGINFDLLPIDSSIIRLKTYDHSEIQIASNKKIKLFRNDNWNEISINNLRNEIFLIIKNNINTNINMIIEEGVGKLSNPLKGIIYLEGDLHLSSEFYFDGIIIVTGNIYVDEDAGDNFRIRGIILTEGNINSIENINIIYNRDSFYKYGIYLPGFIKPRLEVYKKL